MDQGGRKAAGVCGVVILNPATVEKKDDQARVNEPVPGRNIQACWSEKSVPGRSVQASQSVNRFLEGLYRHVGLSDRSVRADP